MPDDTPPVSLREITRDNLDAILELSVAEPQKRYVATNAVSLAQAHFAPEAWFRAIYCGDEPAGFVMLEDYSLVSPPPEKLEIGVWRFMIDQRFQRRGVGRAAMLQVIEHVRRKGLFSSLLLSYVPGHDSPEAFYRSLGFRPNGEMNGQEVVLELPLTDAQSP
ncbi:GNAT family N-acetyltransferase [Sorangium sp. So ce315]|uniref:GNAT family N-acetyltransferase n=1 Tax=Sorangium sp. So ce315 TaxID=3133299 RepID=UPI003F5F3250